MKRLLISSCIVSGIILTGISSANAVELKKPNVSALKNSTVVSKTKSSAKSVANQKYQKEYQLKLNEQAKKLADVKQYDKAARLELAKVILSSEQVKEINSLKGEEQDTKLNENLIQALSDESFVQTYAEYSLEKKNKYKKAVENLKIANNRYKNVSNEITAPLKAIVDGNVSAISAKDELKNAGAMILGIKKNLGTNAGLMKAVKKANKLNGVVVSVPNEERVVYPSTGVVGSINKQIDDINNSVNVASSKLANIIYTQEELGKLKALQNNPDMTKEEKGAEAKKIIDDKITDGTMKKHFDSMTAAQKKEYEQSVQAVMNGVASYTAVALECTKLGFNIAKNPLIATPLVFEVGALKDTASLVKASASDLTKSISQIKKINKAVGITVKTAKKSPVNNVKKNNIKNVNLLKK